jgi:hypothetical protein
MRKKVRVAGGEFTGSFWRFVKADLLAWLRGEDEGNQEEK